MMDYNSSACDNSNHSTDNDDITMQEIDDFNLRTNSNNSNNNNNKNDNDIINVEMDEENDNVEEEIYEDYEDDDFLELDPRFYECLYYREGQRYIINDILPNPLLIECFYFTIMMKNDDGVKFKSWSQYNQERLSLELVCRHWSQILKSTCRSLSMTKHNISSLSKSIMTFRNLRKIELVGGDYPDTIALQIGRLMQMSHPTLESIDFSMTNLTFKHMEMLSESLKMSSSANSIIKSLNFESNEIGDLGVKYICESIQYLTSLQSLDLQVCESADGLTHIGKLLETNNTITDLNWSYNLSDYSSMISLSDGLRVNSSVSKLSLRCCHIEGWGAFSLCDTLKLNQSLKYLDISENDLYDNGANSLSKNLNYSKLTHLDVSCNAITSEGLNPILNALCTNQTLTYIDLSSNLIESNSIIPMLSEFLKSNHFLQTLKLSNSNLTDSHMEFISNGLLFNKTLTTLDISKNNFHSIIPFISIITNNVTLKYLNLSKHKFKEYDLYNFIKYLLKIPFHEPMLLDNYIQNSIPNEKHQKLEEAHYNNIVKDVKHQLTFTNVTNSQMITSELKNRMMKILKSYGRSSKTKIKLQ
ncbi:SH3 domain-containing protein [Tieghemostelium lacteum]|uniref:SH3 domain-containing protein n=1 Tax=Tieghemostelium lacteum TaxID=361077 RepID=A0A151ZE67_TIELA|nr:SH3 domain-containing protein [Tieghemostelium lacteum]|eukprot:KYQ92241.1 SH3 domain-containing protein [Tieghemostelium lacteum]